MSRYQIRQISDFHVMDKNKVHSDVNYNIDNLLSFEVCI